MVAALSWLPPAAALAHEPCPPVEVEEVGDEAGDGQGIDQGDTGADEAVEPPAEPSHPRLAPALWCPVHRGSPADDAPSCDAGLAVALHTWRRFSAVAVVGADTVGAGLAWVAYRGDSGPVVAVAAGVVARYDSRGVDGGELFPAVGITANLWRRP